MPISSRSSRGFLRAWETLLGGRAIPDLTRPGRPPRVPVAQLLATLTYHVLQGVGTVAEHFAELFDDRLAESSWADRRARLPWDVFADLMARALRPRARPGDAAAFGRHWRLVAIDATHFNLRNTAAIRAQTTKARTRRGRAAFAKLTTAVLLELGLHNPIAAAIARQRESEWALAPALLAQLPARSLLLGDRLYGVAAFVVAARTACTRVGSHFLLRAGRTTQARPQQRLRDGSQLVAIAYRDRQRPAHIVEWITVREIRVRVSRGPTTHILRLWTSLLDPTTAPADELAAVYAQRWEHELYFREIKRQLHRTALLHSHTLETAAQEVAALILASAILATERQHIAGGQLPATRVSFSKVLLLTQAMWLTVELADDLLTTRQVQAMLREGRKRLRHLLVPPRRARSCLRAVRQPTKAWPRLLTPRYVTGPPQLTVITAP